MIEDKIENKIHKITENNKIKGQVDLMKYKKKLENWLKDLKKLN